MQFQNDNQHFGEGSIVFTSGVRRLINDETTQCIKCGHDEHKAMVLKVDPPTIPKAGYIHCPLCGPIAYRADEWNPSYREERARIEMEIREVFFEETQRGVKGASSGSSGRRRERKPGDKLVLRHEQDWHGFAPTHDIRTTTLKVQNSDQELNVRVPRHLKDELKNAASHRRVPISIVFREAVADTLPSLVTISKIERGTPRSMIHQMVTAGEKGMLEREATARQATMSDLVSEVLTVYFYRNP